MTLTAPATDHRLDTLGPRPGRAARAVAVSPDGGTAAVSAGSGVQLWPLGTSGSLRLLDVTTAAVTGLAHSPDGRLLAVRSEADLVVVDLASGQATLRLGLGDSSGDVAFGPAGRHVVTAGPRVADLRSGTWTGTLPSTEAGLAGSADRSVLAVPTRIRTAVAGGSQVQLWRWPGPKPFRTVAENADLRAIAVSPTGDRLAAADVDGRVITWTTSDGRRTVLPRAGTDAVLLAFDGPLLLGWEEQADALHAWDPATAALIGTWTLDTPAYADSQVPSTAIAAAPSGLLTGHWDGHLTRWSTRTPTWIADLCALARVSATRRKSRSTSPTWSAPSTPRPWPSRAGRHPRPAPPRMRLRLAHRRPGRRHSRRPPGPSGRSLAARRELPPARSDYRLRA